MLFQIAWTYNPIVSVISLIQNSVDLYYFTQLTKTIKVINFYDCIHMTAGTT